MREPRKPRKPSKPDKMLEPSYKTVPLDNYSEYKLSDLLSELGLDDMIVDNSKLIIDIDYSESEYSSDNESCIKYELPERPNPDYDKQFKHYEEKMREYEFKMEEYRLKKKAYDKWVKEENIRTEERILKEAEELLRKAGRL